MIEIKRTLRFSTTCKNCNTFLGEGVPPPVFVVFITNDRMNLLHVTILSDAREIESLRIFLHASSI